MDCVNVSLAVESLITNAYCDARINSLTLGKYFTEVFSKSIFKILFYFVFGKYFCKVFYYYQNTFFALFYFLFSKYF
jgi:hypothetical protein